MRRCLTALAVTCLISVGFAVAVAVGCIFVLPNTMSPQARDAALIAGCPFLAIGFVAALAANHFPEKKGGAK